MSAHASDFHTITRTPITLHDDILRTIFDYMISDLKRDFSIDRRKKIRKRLFSCALVSRTFSGPAVDALWKVMDTLNPLLSLISEVSNVDGTVSLKDLNICDWNAFNVYSLKIRTLFLRPGSNNIDHLTLVARHRSFVLLPQLRSLILTSKAGTQLYPDRLILPFLAGPHLQQLHFRNSLHDLNIRQWLKDATPRISLTELRLEIPQIISVLTSFSQFTALRLLKVRSKTPLPFSCWEDLAQLPQLEHLDVDDVPEKTIRRGFSTLRALSIYCASKIATTLLDAIRSTQLMTFTFDPTGQQDQPEIVISDAFFNDLFSFLLRQTSIHEIDIDFEDLWDHKNQLTMPEQWFKSLAQLTNVRRFSLLNVPWMYNNASVRLLATAFPQIEELYLSKITHRINDRTKPPDIRSLRHIVHSCPSIQTLQFSMATFYCIVYPEDVLQRRHLHALQEQYKLRTLNILGPDDLVNPAYLKKSLLFARYLEAIVPSIETVKLNSVVWEVVQQGVELCKAVRACEGEEQKFMMEQKRSCDCGEDDEYGGGTVVLEGIGRGIVREVGMEGVVPNEDVLMEI